MIYAADIHAVKAVGLGQWQRDNYCPLRSDQYDSIELFLWKLFNELYVATSEDERPIVLSDAKYVVAIVHYVSAVATHAECLRLGIEPVYGPISRPMLKPPWEVMGRAVERELLDRRIVSAARAARRYMRSISYAGYLPWSMRLAGSFRPDAWGIGSASEWVREYAAKSDIYVRYTIPAALYSGFQNQSAELSSELIRRVGEFVSRADEFMKASYRCGINGIDIASSWCRRLATLKKAYLHLCRSRHVPNTILITELANPLHRIAGHAFDAAGKTSLVFHHGNSTEAVRHVRASYIDRSAGSRYVCPTVSCAEAYAEHYAQCDLSRYRSVEYVSLNTEKYARLVDDCRRKPIPEQIKTVMVMGFPMNAYRYLVPGNYFAPQLDLDIRLVRWLKQFGFRVYYKIHPDRLGEALDIFRPICDEVIASDFEEVWERADAFLFKYSLTSTFIYACCTNRPVIWIDAERPVWNVKHHSLIERRCRIVSARMDQNEKFQFDHDVLRDHLMSKPSIPDYQYIEQYLFPNVAMSGGGTCLGA